MNAQETLAIIDRYRGGDDDALEQIPVWVAKPNAYLGTLIRHPLARIVAHSAYERRTTIRGGKTAVAVARLDRQPVPVIIVSDVAGQPHEGHVLGWSHETLLRALGATGETLLSARCREHPMTVRNYHDAMQRRVLAHGGTWLGKCAEDIRSDDDNMVVEICIEHQPEIRHDKPWLVAAYDATQQDHDDIVSRYAREADAQAHAARNAMPEDRLVHGGLTVRKAYECPEHWLVLMMYASGRVHSVDKGYASLAKAERARRKYLPQIGEVTQYMMASRSFSCVVVRETEHGRWTASIGIGSDTRNVPGSHSTSDDAEAAGRAAIKAAWDAALARWERISKREGVRMHVTATPPPVSVYYPVRGVSASDTKPAKCDAKA